MNIEIFQKNLLSPIHIDISYPRGNNYIIITWDEVKNPNPDKSEKVYYNIYKGLSVNGIFYKLNDMPLSSNRYEDFEVNVNPNIQYWYKVSSVYETEYGLIESQLSNPVCYKVHNTDKWFNKMNERNYWILENVGVLCDLYTRKYDGEHCPECYDSIRGRSGNSSCPICFGTGFVGGYDPAYQLYVRFKPVQNSLDISPQMFTYNNQCGAWTISNTKIANRDILINPEGRMFQVLNNAINHAAGYLFHQELNLKEYDQNDPIYKLKRGAIYPLQL